MTTDYSAIGTPGTPWGTEEKQQWLALQTIKRSYQEEVVSKINALTTQFKVEQYGELSYGEHQYPLFVLKSQNWQDGKANVLITGGVHGYETSGVQGALQFAKETAKEFEGDFNFVIFPCISPWGYETINRWNPNAVDPNRSFKPESEAGESALMMQHVASLGIEFTCHIDLHETTDTDNSEFRPALFARDGQTEGEEWEIPDGFYLVGNSEAPEHDFQTSIIDSVRAVTHIAPNDEGGRIIGEKITQEGVINYAVKSLGLCAGVTNAPFTTTTEVYPDSPKVNDAECNDAQVAAIVGGLNFLQTRVPQ